VPRPCPCTLLGLEPASALMVPFHSAMARGRADTPASDGLLAAALQALDGAREVVPELVELEVTAVPPGPSAPGGSVMGDQPRSKEELP
jgi:hypothetical protein